MNKSNNIQAYDYKIKLPIKQTILCVVSSLFVNIKTPLKRKGKYDIQCG